MQSNSASLRLPQRRQTLAFLCEGSSLQCGHSPPKPFPSSSSLVSPVLMKRGGTQRWENVLFVFRSIGPGILQQKVVVAFVQAWQRWRDGAEAVVWGWQNSVHFPAPFLPQGLRLSQLLQSKERGKQRDARPQKWHCLMCESSRLCHPSKCVTSACHLLSADQRTNEGRTS